jgi:hypothetical protein
MFKQPAEASGPAFWVPRSAYCVEGEANAENPSDQPVCNRMAGEIEENPSRDHGDDSSRGRTCGPSRRESKSGSRKTGKLHRISDRYRKAAKDFASRRQV